MIKNVEVCVQRSATESKYTPKCDILYDMWCIWIHLVCWVVCGSEWKCSSNIAIHIHHTQTAKSFLLTHTHTQSHFTSYSAGAHPPPFRTAQSSLHSPLILYCSIPLFTRVLHWMSLYVVHALNTESAKLFFPWMKVARRWANSRVTRETLGCALWTVWILELDWLQTWSCSGERTRMILLTAANQPRASSAQAADPHTLICVVCVCVVCVSTIGMVQYTHTI